MRTLKLVVLTCVIGIAVWSFLPYSVIEVGATKGKVLLVNSDDRIASITAPAEEAPTGFGESVGDVSVGAEFSNFAENRFHFALDEGFTLSDETSDPEEAFNPALGPVFNETGCAKCHDHPTIGGTSHVFELRAGHFDGRNFIDHPGDSLIHSRAVDPSIQEQVLPGNEVRDFRGSLQLWGLGFVEALSNDTLIGIADKQPGQSGGRINGQVIRVEVLEVPGSTRVGRFGWKNQQASLLSFAADAYTNEMGITTPVLPTENTSNGRPLGPPFDTEPAGCVGLGCRTTPDESDNDDILFFAHFMRALKAPPRNAAIAGTRASRDGEALFNNIGCAICHVTTLTTAPAGTVINAGAYTVQAPLGNKTFHPFSDFLLHDVGTGDGIVQNGGQSTRNKIRTTPLWGLRTRNRFLHNGLALTVDDAIRSHGGESSFVIDRFRRLSQADRNRILTFLSSL